MSETNDRPSDTPVGVDLVIVGAADLDGALLRPKSLRINGVETYVPDGAQLAINGDLRRVGGALTATITMLVRTVTIDHPSPAGPGTIGEHWHIGIGDRGRHDGTAETCTQCRPIKPVAVADLTPDTPLPPPLSGP